MKSMNTYKHQLGTMWHARVSGHGEHKFAVGLSIGLTGPSFSTATREKKMNSEVWLRVKTGKREQQEDKGAFLLLILAPWWVGGK